MQKFVSKSKFKPRALEYFREVQKTGKEIIITDKGKPVAKIIPYQENAKELLNSLRGTVLKYIDPTEPVDSDTWEASK